MQIFDAPLYAYQRSPDQDAHLPVRHSVVVVGAGPVGLAAAIDLAQHDIPVIVIDDNDKVSSGSRAICFAKRSLEILDRLGVDREMVDKGITWNVGKVFFDERQVYEFDLLRQTGHKRPAFINLQQYYLEQYLVERVRHLQGEGKSIEIRGNNKLIKVDQHDQYVDLEIETPEGNYTLEADWLIACDGANSPTRKMMGLDFVGRVFEDNFLIADVKMDAGFPTERWFWFDPPFNRGQSALLHKQPDGVWRIDLQLGWDVDREKEKDPERVTKRLKAMLGDKIDFTLEWVSIYTFQCRRMEKFRHGRIFFAGDSAHQVSPFGARGANSGIQDIDNLAWKLAAVIKGSAGKALLETYDQERIFAADENIRHSTQSTDFITPKSIISRLFRNSVLELSEKYSFARPLVNSGRLSVPCCYEGYGGKKQLGQARIGAPALDCPIGNEWLLDALDGRFHLLSINGTLEENFHSEGHEICLLALNSCDNPHLRARYLGDQKQAFYLIRPDQHIIGVWAHFDEGLIAAAMQSEITGSIK